MRSDLVTRTVPLLQERSQLPDHVVAEIVRKSRKESSNRVAVGWRSLAERYVQHGCALRIWIRLRTTSGESHDLRLSVYRALNTIGRAGGKSLRVYLDRLLSEDRHGEHSMLIQVPELIQDPQFLAGEGIPSVKRLKILNDASGVWMDCPDSLVQLLLSGFSRPKDRKFTAFRSLFGKWPSRVSPREGEDELIEGRAQVVNAVSRDQRNSISRGDCRGIHDDQIVTGLRVGLLSNEVRVDIDPLLYGKVQILQVEPCPIHLELESGLAS